MIYEPKIIFNPTNKPIEFMHSGTVYIFKPGEKKNLEGFVAYHVLNHVNSELKEYEPEGDDDKVLSSDVAYDKMPWRDLVALASKRGLFKPGTGKDEVITALLEADEQGA